MTIYEDKVVTYDLIEYNGNNNVQCINKIQQYFGATTPELIRVENNVLQVFVSWSEPPGWVNVGVGGSVYVQRVPGPGQNVWFGWCINAAEMQNFLDYHTQSFGQA